MINKKKIKKLLLVFFVVISIISFSCISASAATTYNISCSQPQLQGNDCYLEIVTESGMTTVIYCKAITNSTLETPSLNVSFYAYVNVDYLWISASPNSYTVNGQRYEIHTYGMYFLDYGFSYTTLNQGSLTGFYLGNTGSVIGVNGYNCDVTNVGTFSGFTFAYGNDVNINNKLDSIIAGIQGGNQQIIDNQNQNTDKVTANQDKNTEEIKNGWQNDKELDKSKTDEYQNKEQELMDGTAEARASSVNFLNNFGGLLNDTSISKGLLAVSSIMTQFFNIGWLSGLVNFALSIGAFAFIIGSVVMVVGKVSSNSKAKERSAYMSAKSEYFKSRSDYFKSKRGK